MINKKHQTMVPSRGSRVTTDYNKGRYVGGGVSTGNSNKEGIGIWNNKVLRNVDRGTEYGAGSWNGNGRGIG